MQHPIATLEMSNGARIVCELYPEEAPNTVASFIHLAALGVFDNHAMERIAPDYVADMSYTAFHREEAKYLIAYETRDAGFPNHLAAVPGMLCMGGYRQGIAGGEFFFPFKESDKITWHYPAFGKVIEGWDEILRWNTLPVETRPYPGNELLNVTVPVDPPVILRCTVDTHGVQYPQPVRLTDVSLPKCWE